MPGKADTDKAEAMPTVTDTEAERIRSFPTLSTYLPIVFKNGAEISRLTVNCGCCSRELVPDDIQAEVENNGKKAVVKAYGVCLPCKTLTPLEARLRDDGSMLIKIGTGWREGRYIKEGKPKGALGWCKEILSHVIIK